MDKNRLVFIAVLLTFLINAELCWGAGMMPGYDVAAVFEKRIYTIAVVVKPANNQSINFQIGQIESQIDKLSRRRQNTGDSIYRI